MKDGGVLHTTICDEWSGPHLERAISWSLPFSSRKPVELWKEEK